MLLLIQSTSLLSCDSGTFFGCSDGGATNPFTDTGWLLICLCEIPPLSSELETDELKEVTISNDHR